MSNSVQIDPVRLHKVCRTCLRNIRDYQGEQSTYEFVTRFSWRKLRKVQYKLWTHPRWVEREAGIITRLQNLKVLAEGALGTSSTITLTHTTYTELYKLLNKDNSFEPHVFGNGY